MSGVVNSFPTFQQMLIKCKLFEVLQKLTASLMTPCSWRNRKGNKILFKLSRMSALLTCLRGSLWFSGAFSLYLLRLPPETNNNTPWLFSSWFRSMIFFVFVRFLILTNFWKPKNAQICDIYFFLSVLTYKIGFFVVKYFKFHKSLNSLCLFRKRTDVSEICIWVLHQTRLIQEQLDIQVYKAFCV